MDEIIVVSSVVDKLPPFWKDTKRTLKHKTEDMSLEDLANHLHIEEELHLQDESKDNNNKGNNNKGNKKAKAVCWECNKPSHKKRNCSI